jgi:hypothetical protein
VLRVSRTNGLPNSQRAKYTVRELRQAAAPSGTRSAQGAKGSAGGCFGGTIAHLPEHGSVGQGGGMSEGDAAAFTIIRKNDGVQAQVGAFHGRVEKKGLVTRAHTLLLFHNIASNFHEFSQIRGITDG